MLPRGCGTRLRVNFGFWVEKQMLTQRIFGPASLSLGRLAELRRAPARKRAGLVLG